MGYGPLEQGLVWFGLAEAIQIWVRVLNMAFWIYC